MKIIVYSFKRPYSASRDVEVIPPYKMAEEDIRLDQSHVIPNTAEEVDASSLDHRGRYFPRRR